MLSRRGPSGEKNVIVTCLNTRCIPLFIYEIGDGSVGLNRQSSANGHGALRFSEVLSKHTSCVTNPTLHPRAVIHVVKCIPQIRGFQLAKIDNEVRIVL